MKYRIIHATTRREYHERITRLLHGNYTVLTHAPAIVLTGTSINLASTCTGKVARGFLIQAFAVSGSMLIPKRIAANSGATARVWRLPPSTC